MIPKRKGLVYYIDPDAISLCIEEVGYLAYLPWVIVVHFLKLLIIWFVRT
jgi:hypothetical protein